MNRKRMRQIVPIILLGTIAACVTGSSRIDRLFASVETAKYGVVAGAKTVAALSKAGLISVPERETYRANAHVAIATAESLESLILEIVRSGSIGELQRDQRIAYYFDSLIRQIKILDDLIIAWSKRTKQIGTHGAVEGELK